ncbi:hypothetical protein ACN28G_09000 [Micromonospora sp. WMMA1923]|uniref:hypothetical protein n=1 Tax=Micromonospora sp. WMMA1923 TaxID=3404125 RepID=UPI003B95B634
MNSARPGQIQPPVPVSGAEPNVMVSWFHRLPSAVSVSYRVLTSGRKTTRVPPLPAPWPRSTRKFAST